MADNVYRITIPKSGTYEVRSPRPLSDVEAYQAALAMAKTPAKPKKLASMPLAPVSRGRDAVDVAPPVPFMSAPPDIREQQDQAEPADVYSARTPATKKLAALSGAESQQNLRQQAAASTGITAAVLPETLTTGMKKNARANRTRMTRAGFPKAIVDMSVPSDKTIELVGSNAANLVNPFAPVAMAAQAVANPDQFTHDLKKSFTDLFDSSAKPEERIQSAINWVGLALPLVVHGAGQLGALGEGIAEDFAKGLNHAESILKDAPQTPDVAAARAAVADAVSSQTKRSALKSREGKVVLGRRRAAVHQDVVPEAPMTPAVPPPDSSTGVHQDVIPQPPKEAPVENAVQEPGYGAGVHGADADAYGQAERQGQGQGQVQEAQAPAGEPAPVHPEGAVGPEPGPPASEPAAPPDLRSTVTQGHNAATAEERKAIGLDELPETQRKTFAQSLEGAKSAGLDRQAATIAEEVNSKPRALSDEETAGMVLRKAQLKAEHRAAMMAMEHAIDAGSREQVARFGLQLDLIEGEFDKITQALKTGGTETGRALNARKMALNTDYDLVSVLQRAKAKKEAALTAFERANFEALTKQVEALQAQLNEARARGGSRVRPNPKAGGAQAPKSVLDKVTAGNTVFTAERVNAALKDLLGAPLGSGAEGVARIGKAAYEVAGAFVEAGYRRFSRFMVELKNAHPEIASRLSIEEWKAVHDRAKADLDQQTARGSRPLPPEEKAVMEELKAARRERAKALGAANAEERQREALQKAAHQQRAEEMAKEDQKVRNQRRQEIRQAFAEEAKAQKQAQADYEREYRQKANDAAVLQHTQEMFQEMARYGIDPKDIEHQGAMEHFVGELLDAGKGGQEVVDAVKARLPDANPYDMMQLIRKGVAEYRKRFQPGRSISELYLERGKAALLGEDVGTIRRHYDALLRQVDAEVGRLKPRPGYEKLDQFLTSNALASITNRLFDVAANTVSLAGFLIEHPIRATLTPLLDRFVLGAGGFGVERPLTPTRLSRIVKGAGERLKLAAEETIKGTDPDTLAKYGSGNIVTRATGLTDVPFKEFFTQLRLDDLASTMAEHLAKDKSEIPGLRDQILEQFRSPEAKGPLSGAEIEDGLAIAHDYALRQTFNVGNVASAFTEGTKGALQKAGKGMGPAGEQVAGYANTLLVKPVTRFSKVIGNVALDRANYHPILGLGETVARIVAGKATKTPFSPAQAALIGRLASKGLAGIALVQMGRYLLANGVLKPQMVITKGGKRFIDWGDLEQLGGAVSAILYGATLESANSEKMTDAQRRQFIWDTNVGILSNQPLMSGPERLFGAMQNERSAGKFAGQVAANTLIPSFIRDWARRDDAVAHGKDPFHERRVNAPGFVDQFEKNIPFVRRGMEDAPTGGAKKKFWLPKRGNR